MGIELEIRQGAVRLHGRMCHFVGNVAPFGNVVGIGKSPLRIAKNMVIIFLDVVRPVLMNQVRLRFH